MSFYDDKVKELTSVESELASLKEDHEDKKLKAAEAEAELDKAQEKFDAILLEIEEKMDEDGVRHVDKDYFEIKKPKGKPVLKILDEKNIPSEFTETKKVPKKIEIKKYISSLEDKSKIKWAEIVEGDSKAKVTFKEPDM